ncbi:MBD2 [Lepeophtheirus salmonis]|uniref:MBD2 n=1 Tax=Lepeophtheirus salmonis TaxID=72036 RepID=A0A7R8CLH6_LEPSM|nr:MBD2 [Lepeophtheirus salmonis]CAF2823457.1 MBD2 [Lepeophtheirus salmonis]
MRWVKGSRDEGSSPMYGNEGVRRVEVSTLPRGWCREEISRGNRTDVHYISPLGVRVRNRNELGKQQQQQQQQRKYESHAFTTFHFCEEPSKTRAKTYDFTKTLKNDASLVPPIRQTASIFKQPVTVHKIHKEHSKVKSDFKGGSNSNSEKPRQLFWEKRLSGLRASYPDEDYEPFSLPSNITAVGPGVNNDIVLASIATVLHMGNGSINGQSNNKVNNFEKNPGVYVDPDQPLIGGVSVTQADVEKQEERVDAARKALEEALESLTE